MPVPFCLASLLRPLFSDLLPTLFLSLIALRSVSRSNAVLSSMCVNAHFYNDIKYDYVAFSRCPRAAEYLASFFVPIRDHYERVYGQLQRLGANSDDVFWMDIQKELFMAVKSKLYKHIWSVIIISILNSTNSIIKQIVCRIIF